MGFSLENLYEAPLSLGFDKGRGKGNTPLADAAEFLGLQSSEPPKPPKPSSQEDALTQKWIEGIDQWLKQAGFSAELAQALLPMMLSEAGYDYTPGALISGTEGSPDAKYGKPKITKKPPTESDIMAQKIQDAANQYTLNAIEGNLPVSPALERSLSQTEDQIRQTAGQDLGPGWETGTPGIETLARERERQDTIREAVRFGQLSDINAIGMAREGQRTGTSAQRYGQLSGAGQPGLNAGYAIGAAAQGYQGPIGTLANERWNTANYNYQMKKDKEAKTQALIQMVMGAGAGAFLGPAAGLGMGGGALLGATNPQAPGTIALYQALYGR